MKSSHSERECRERDVYSRQLKRTLPASVWKRTEQKYAKRKDGNDLAGSNRKKVGA